jgi:PST family polysaccharide transporter
MKNQLKNNLIALTLLQIGNYLVPLAVFPYLTRVLGVDGFGRIGFATAFTMYFVLIVEWGFNLSSTRDVSVSRADKDARSKIFWETLAARWILLAISLIALVVLVNLVARLNNQSLLLWLGTLQILATTLSTAFYYQGIEQISRMAQINLVIRFLSIPLIFVMVSEPDDVVLAFAIQTGCFLLASVVNLLMLLMSDQICWIKPSIVGVYRKLGAGFPLFLSAAGGSLFNNSNAVVLGFVASDAAVGYFVAGFTLVKAVVGLSGPFAQAVFPRASHMISSEPDKAPAFVRKMIIQQLLLGVFLTTAIWIFLPWGVTWFYGDQFKESIPVIAWLSLLPILTCVASAIGMQTLVPLGHNRWFASMFLVSGIANLLMLLPMGYAWGAVGGSIAILITEVVMMSGMALGLKKLEPRMWHLVFAKT